ncbi:hypothetical protein OHA44_38260 (plasmid) [Streptomyces sp. NBC_00144]|uniref:hypothetical protein n=1 Tax=Streptomyces sp. NBC_00144 TaxID=2975665 RepID=UPI003252784B
MTTTRRPLGHGPQAKADSAAFSSDASTGAPRVRAAEADVAAAPLYRPGGMQDLQALRDRGVLGPSQPRA